MTNSQPAAATAYATRESTSEAAFDETTHVWTIGGRRARVVIATDGSLPAALAVGSDSLSPYLGVAVPGAPNYFLITGPDARQQCHQKGYVAACLAFMDRTSSTRIEVRPSAQRTYNDRSRLGAPRSGRFWRRVAKRIPSAFEVRTQGFDHGPDDSVYDGPATVTIGEQHYPTHVRLTGGIDPIDGHYHWRGTLFDPGLELRLPREVVVTVEGRSAVGRLTERTPWSTFSVAGTGAPPFALETLMVEMPRL